MTLSSMYFDRLRCICNECLLIGRRVVLVSNVVHSAGEDSRRDFHPRETAKQILTRLVWKLRYGYDLAVL
jgi:hypothetical protein